ncbi:MAG: SDR family NAD(P)-dependent oxidoreductase, partial [Endozoicomonas sp.]
MSLTSDKPKKNVLLTGCSTGIGHTLALELHQRGYHVWATARNLQSLQDLSGQGIQTLMLDVTNGDQIREVVDHIYKTDGHLDILVNNAGYGSMGPLIAMDT